jgi:phosphatidate phosphatase PAH1
MRARTVISSLCVGALLGTAACTGAPEGVDEPFDATGWNSDKKTDDPCSHPSPEKGEWEHSILVNLTIQQGGPHHGAVDVLANPGESARVEGRFAYGPFLKNLEDEVVVGYARTGECEWTEIGRAFTDETGTVAIDMPADLLGNPGRYDVEFVVSGDLSSVPASVWVVEPGTDVVVFDIDGTLTTGDSQLVEQILLGDDPDMYDAADEVVRTYVDHGYMPVYLTGRPLYLDGRTREWLARRGFPRAPLMMAPTLIDALPQGTFVGDFKELFLLHLQQLTNLDVKFAYGNATTDICAYVRAGIPAESSHIIGKHAGEGCDGITPQALTDYPSHLPSLKLLPSADGR